MRKSERLTDEHVKVVPGCVNKNHQYSTVQYTCLKADYNTTNMSSNLTLIQNE